MTDGITFLAKSNKYIRKYFLGTSPADVKPHYQKSLLLGCKTDKSGHEGEHWVATFKNHSQLFFFYTFGKSPQFYNRTYWIDQQLQSEVSIICGGWCLYYLHKKGKHGIFTAKIMEPTLLNHLFFKT